jgi:Cu(I)/Ag(I) efflux system membrane fusion protein
MKRTAFFSVLVLAMLSFAFYGCSSPSSTTEPAADAENTHGDHDHGDHSAADMEKVEAALAKLPPEDRAAAKKQHICPVTGEMLGSMGTPQKVEVNGQEVWICCDGCKDKLQENPEKYLSKLDP